MQKLQYSRVQKTEISFGNILALQHDLYMLIISSYSGELKGSDQVGWFPAFNVKKVAKLSFFKVAPC